jgi:glycosyltransferase involved in cell wall biosynthesis
MREQLEMNEMTQKQLKIIAGMPAFNESKYVGTMVLDTRQYVNEIIVVDDGSSDETSKMARLAGANVVTHERNKGYGAAIQSIFAEAKKSDADVLVILDADAQHHPKDIPDMIQPILNGYDMVIGSRKQQSEKIPLFRRIGQKVILNSVNILNKTDLTDSESGFRAFSRKAIESLELKESGMAVSAETVAEAFRLKLKVTEVPISITYSKDSSTLNPVSHGLGVFTRIIVMISEQRPLFFFGIVGIILVIAGLSAGFYALKLYSNSNVISVGWSLVAMFLLIVGLLSGFNGITLHALYRIIHQAISKEKR